MMFCSCFNAAVSLTVTNEPELAAPQAFRLSARPAASMFLAAFTSRSCIVPHAAQVHSRTCNGFGPSFAPHAEHTWLVGCRYVSSSRPAGFGAQREGP